jgi:gluconolactonase
MKQMATGYTLIEGPVWRQDGLLFSDVHEGGVYCLAESGEVEPVVAHRRGIGGIALHGSGGLVVGGRNVAYKGPAAEGTVVLLDREGAGDVIGFNDLTTDAAGRIYVGSLGASPFDAGAPAKDGYLHLIDLDGSSRVVADGVRLTNGLGFSPDGRRLYHSDSRRGLVGVYAVGADGSLGAREVFARVEQGAPDGLAVARDGSVWVAVAGGGVVRIYEADGRERAPLGVPLPMVTSLCFGGDELRDLYVVTGSEGAPDDHSGSVYRTTVDVPGLAVAPARIRVGSAC